MPDNNKELATQRKIRYLLWSDDAITHVIEATERGKSTFIIDDDDGNQYKVIIKKVE